MSRWRRTQRVEFRIGINVGDNHPRWRRYLSATGVKRPRRAWKVLSEPGGICVQPGSSGNEVRDKLLVLIFEDMGEQSVKNIARSGRSSPNSVFPGRRPPPWRPKAVFGSSAASRGNSTALRSPCCRFANMSGRCRPGIFSPMASRKTSSPACPRLRWFLVIAREFVRSSTGARRWM